MRLLLIARPFVFYGGVERATAGLVGALVARGHDVHLLSPGTAVPVAGVTLHPLGLPRLPPTARILAFAALARRAVGAGRLPPAVGMSCRVTNAPCASRCIARARGATARISPAARGPSRGVSITG